MALDLTKQVLIQITRKASKKIDLDKKKFLLKSILMVRKL